MLSTEALIKLRTRHQTPFVVKAICQTHRTHVVTEANDTVDNSNGMQPKQLTLSRGEFQGFNCVSKCRINGLPGN